jgi:putative transposase
LRSSDTKLSARDGCKLLNINRSSLYYKSTKDHKNSDLCSLVLDIWLDRNNKGWRSIRADLKEYHNIVVNHKKLRRLMKKIGIQGILPKKSTSKSNPNHYKYAYGLKNMEINRANIAWCSDISYVKLPQGYVYLVAIVDIYSRMVLDYEISNTLDTEFCLRCLERCVNKYGAPVVFNSDQGVQYTSNSWIEMLLQYGIMISMDGKRRWADNIWIERIWRTIKYECIHMAGVESLIQLKTELSNYIVYYNNKRLHSSIGYKQPAKYYQISIEQNLGKEYLVYCKLDENSVTVKTAA